MAVIIVPNTGSTFTAAGCVVGSQNSWAWFGVAVPATASGSAIFYRTASPTSGCEIMVIAACAGQMPQMYGPFSAPNGIYFGVSGASVIVWLKQRSTI